MKVKAMYKLLCGTLAGLLLFAGCSTAAEGEATPQSGNGSQGGVVQAADGKGRWLEVDITPAEILNEGYPISVHQLYDGALLLQGRDAGDNDLAYTSKDNGDSWQREDIEPLQAAMQQEDWYRYTLDMQGGYWAGTSDETGLGLYHITAEGERREISLADLAAATTPGAILFGLEPTGSGVRLVAMAGETLTFAEVSHEGTILYSFTAPSYPVSYAVRESTLYMLDLQGMLQVYDMDTGALLRQIEMPLEESELFSHSFLFDAEEDGGISYLSSGGISRLEQDGRPPQPLVAERGYLYSTPYFSARGFVRLGGGMYLAAGSENTAGRVVRYQYDAEADAIAGGTLTVWALQDSHPLQMAAYAFARQNPGWQVDIQLGRDATGEQDAQTDQDILKALNLRMLAGDMPDILVLDGLPVGSYAAAGLLQDISGLVDEAEYYPGLLHAYRDAGGAVYGYPALFEAPMLMGRADAATPPESITTLEQLAEALTPEKVFIDGWEDTFRAAYMAYSPEIFPNGDSVNEQALQSFFAATYKIMEQNNAGGFAQSPSAGYMSNNYTSYNTQPALDSYIYGSEGLAYGIGVVGDISEIAAAALYQGETHIAGLPGNAFIPVLGAGIPVGAPNEAEARSFIAAMLQSDDVQRLGYTHNCGFAVRRGVSEAQVEAMMLRMAAYYAEMDMEEGYLSDPQDMNWDAFFESFTDAAHTDVVLYGKVYEAAEQLYTGRIGREAAVAQVVQGTSLFFAERLQ